MTEKKETAAKKIDFIALHRPWLDENGLSRVTINGHTHISSMPAKFTQEEWEEMDRIAARGFAHRSPVATVFEESGLTVPRFDGSGFNGLGEMLLEQQVANEDWDCIRLQGAPLKVTWAEFGEIGPGAIRRMAMRHNHRYFSTCLPLDTVSCEAAARVVGEAVDRSIVDLMVSSADKRHGATVKSLIEEVGRRHYWSGRPSALFYSNRADEDVEAQQIVLDGSVIKWRARTDILSDKKMLVVRMEKNRISPKLNQRDYCSDATIELIVNLKPTVIQFGERLAVMAVMNPVMPPPRSCTPAAVDILLGGEV